MPKKKRRTIRMPYTAITTETTAVDNRTTLNTELDAMISAEEGKFAGVEGDEAVYGGIVAIDLDGAIQQVIWSMGRSQAATTRAGRNKPAERMAESEKARKRREQALRESDDWNFLVERMTKDPVFESGGTV